MKRELLPAEKRSRIAVVGTVGVLVLLGVALYWNALGNEFVYDDKEIVLKNQWVRDPANFGRLFTRDYFKISGERTYRPLNTATVFLDWALWKDDPAGHRILNVALHVGSAILLYACVLAGIGARKAALFASLIFLVHTAGVEAVAVVSNREDGLALFFGLGGFYLFIRSLRDGAPALALRAGSAASLVLALLAKETALCFPLILAAYVWVRSKGETERGWIRRAAPALCWPFLIFPAFLLVRFVLFPNAEGLAEHPGGSAYRTALTMPTVFLRYFRIMLWPSRLCADYDLKPAMGIGEDGVFWSIAASAVLLLAAAWLLARRTWAGFWAAWIWIGFLPVSNLIPFGALMADRYVYFPCVGYAGLMGTALAWLYKLRMVRPPVRAPKWAALGTAAVLVVSYGTMTVRRNADWRTSLSIWSHAAACAPESSRAQNNLANALSERGEYAEALKRAELAVALDEVHGRAFNTLAYIRWKLGDSQGALEAYRTATLLEPRFAEAYYNAGLALLDMGDGERAERALAEALRIDPSWPQAVYAMGNALLKTGRKEQAVERYKQALEMDPNYTDALGQLAIAYAESGKPKDAVRTFESFLDLKPNDRTALFNYSALLTNLAAEGRCAESRSGADLLLKRYPRGRARGAMEALKRAIDARCAGRDGG